jgi:plasmid stabilization system protein ParE
VADFLFAQRFLQELAEWLAQASPAAQAQLDDALAQIARNPALAGRFPSFYDPLRPSYLLRVADTLIHYRIADNGEVEFLNLFFSRT